MAYRILDNGVYRDMTQEEIKELEKQQAQIVQQPKPTKEELLAKLAELQEQLNSLKD